MRKGMHRLLIFGHREPVAGLFGATPSIAEIWPPNHKFVDITITNILDPDGDPLAVTITKITQDEPLIQQVTATRCLMEAVWEPP